ncbi:unnamed protein product [Photorhabdus laumondii subsp. laumondii TTO1]|uniref:Photorhabdus luminescens subsp. laumondii TTO1 complete genome segment 11/17 n=1 Tax=Photorhabdus laumondii subsp. laumondii (strain DSM 15139 / CIP 105565 / TT01) TaxID=243265 RepID=Q7N2F8_PHOLL|nr:unnamed protein product [Photorhabdus laumondii subsp. laumondii TTO1]
MPVVVKCDKKEFNVHENGQSTFFRFMINENATVIIEALKADTA